MKLTFSKIINTTFLLALLAAGYWYRAEIFTIWQGLYNQYFPCRAPITYSISNFDTRFGISKADFLKSIQQAATIWSSAIDKNLFTYADNGVLKINLIYDERQAATIKLQKLGIEIRNDRATYDMLKEKYESLKNLYESQKQTLATMVAARETALRDYEAEVMMWNSRGGAPKSEFNKLEAERDALNAQIASINEFQNRLNETVDVLNATATFLNKLVKDLNLTVGSYNNIGQEQGEEFQEGVYKRDASGTEIIIYQFDNQAKLVRVLEHELGHALGLEHVENPKAIMYRLNQASNEKLTVDDMDALKALCGVKSLQGSSL